jgi:hypothetical protein
MGGKMKNNKTVFRVLLTMLVVFLSVHLPAKKRWMIDFETGPVFASSNTVQVPNPGGTRFSLTDSFDINKKIYYRLRLSFNLAQRHQLSALFAPLSLTASGELEQDVVFQETTFNTGDSIDALYRFNSYRLTYRYLLLNRDKIKIWIGFTAKIRDAEIRLESDTQEAATTDVGFVPLLNLVLDWKWSEKVGLFFEADALASPGGQGRAEDVSLSFYYRIGQTTRLRLGYRFVEGGADVEQVYNFAFLHYFYLAFQVRF